MFKLVKRNSHVFKISFIVLLFFGSFAFGQQAIEDRVETLIDSLPQNVGGLAVDVLGYIYVADGEVKVWKVNPHTKQAELFADNIYGASGNAFDAAGNFYQAKCANKTTWHSQATNRKVIHRTLSLRAIKCISRNL